MKILFACGGTAGHINPAISIADILKRRIPGLQAVFVGTPEGMENRLVGAAGYPIRHIPVEKLRRSFSPRNIGAAFSLLRSFSVAGRILKEEAPDLVLGTGGYVCYPVLRVASFRGIPTVLHESNVKRGSRQGRFRAIPISYSSTFRRRNGISRARKKPSFRAIRSDKSSILFQGTKQGGGSDCPQTRSVSSFSAGVSARRN